MILCYVTMASIMQLSMPSIWSIIYHEVTNDNTAPQGRGDVDTRSCVVLLLDLFTQWLNGGQLSHVITSEVIRCVSDYYIWNITCHPSLYIGCHHIRSVL